MVERQAVLLIHGIGEQRPMETLRGFVDAVWTTDTSIHNPFADANAGATVWSKPDNVSDNFELRRLTTTTNRAGIGTDFYEFYWQHLLQGTTYAHVVAWVGSLLFRSPSSVPRHLRPVYWILWLVSAIAGALALYTAAATVAQRAPLGSPWLSAVLTVAVVPVFGFFVKNIVGDAARYLHVAPPNVQCRHAIRQAGLKVLTALHDRGYDRIIIVGHSLGSVIAYDILTQAWPSYNTAKPTGDAPVMTALEKLEAEAASPGRPVEEIQTMQRAYFDELAANGNSWRVTDLLTLGSPLAHAEVLLARDRTALAAKQNDRECPTCPPVMELVTRNHVVYKRFSYELDRRKKDGYRIPHHAAMFAPTRWTNLYFPSRWIVKGDLVGGPLSGVLGAWIADVPVATSMRRGFLTHTLYWRRPPAQEAPDHIRTLRRLLNLTDSAAAAAAM